MKSFLKITVKTIILAAMAVCCWQWLTPYFRMEHNEEGDLFKNLPDHTIDVLALGSSHMQYAFNPSVFYANTGYYSYVLGSDCQPFSMSVSLLEEALKTQSPSVVVVDVFTLLSQSEVCYADGMYYLAMEETTGETRVEAGKQVPDKKLGLQYTYDFLMNHSNWKYLDFSHPESIIKNAETSKGYNDTFGYVAQMPTDFSYIPLTTFTPEPYELSDGVKHQLDRMISLCNDNDIQLIFIKTPYTIDQKSTNQLNAIWQYLDSQDQQYIDFTTMTEELHWFTGMDGDTWHNNVWGANIITTYLSEYIQEHSDVSDHVDSSVMDGLLDNASYTTARQLMGPENLNIYDELNAAAKYPCNILVKYTGGYFPIGEYENNLLQSAGINHDFIANPKQGYYAVIQNGKVVQESNQPFECTFNDHEVSLSSSGITIDGESYDDNTGQMELVFCDDQMSWVNAMGLKPSEYGFWKKGCLSWDCGH